MKESTRIRDIYTNIGRAAQYEICGAPVPELRFLLFAEYDLVEELTMYSKDLLSATWRTDKMDQPTAKRYAASLKRVSTRIAELIEDGA